MKHQRESDAIQPWRYLRAIFTLMVVILGASAWAEDMTREELLKKIRGTEALKMLLACRQSEMMALYAQLASGSIKVQGPDGAIEKDEAPDLLAHHQQINEVCEQVLSERGVQSISGPYDLEVEGRCPKSWDWSFAKIGEECEGHEIQQNVASIKIIHTCAEDNQTFELEYTGKTMEDAILMEDFMNSDILYPGRIGNGIIRFLIAANPAKTKWPPFDKPLSSKAKKKCWVTMSLVEE